jgi:8-oxo-dGTP pyrophosphatase MutT (NUDIX family)
MKAHRRLKRRQAAAICWRIKKGKLQYLLIATQKQRLWTFPKGKIEKGESLWQAAKREAREEAKVKGKVSRDPIFALRRKTSKGRILPMSFFLLRWKRKARGKGRQYRWVSFEEAGRLLIDRPDEVYGRGLQQALRKGNARLARQREGKKSWNHKI